VASYTFRVDGMRSASCGLLIDETLADVNGVASSATSLHTRQATVEMDATRCSTDEVVAAIIAAGYIAQLEQPCPPLAHLHARG
jgi:copper chaperone CopZ